MSVESPEKVEAGRPARPTYQEPRGEGWLAFAGTMLALVGTMNVISGIAAIDDANFYTSNAHYVFSDLNTWGWVLLITGTVQVLSGIGIWVRNQFARWLGVGFASLNAIALLLFIQAYPGLALALFAVDILIIYGLVAYGARDRTA